jgi:hypothetical protein
VPSNDASPERRADAPPRRRPAASRHSHAGLVLAGAVIVVAGFAVGLVEVLRFPKGSIWVIVGVTAALVGVIRALTRPR